MSWKLRGADVSSWQGAVVPPGQFCWIKATQGTDYVNREMEAQRASAIHRGEIPAFYHFGISGISPEIQADFFAMHCASQPGDPLAYDWEPDPTTGACPTEREKNRFLQHLEHIRPAHQNGLYCDHYRWTVIDKGGYCGDFLWYAYPNGRPGVIDIAHPVTFHQFSSKPYDQNAAIFDTIEEMRAWCNAKTHRSHKAALEVAGHIHHAKPPVKEVTPVEKAVQIERSAPAKEPTDVSKAPVPTSGAVTLTQPLWLRLTHAADEIEQLEGWFRKNPTRISGPSVVDNVIRELESGQPSTFATRGSKVAAAALAFAAACVGAAIGIIGAGGHPIPSELGVIEAGLVSLVGGILVPNTVTVHPGEISGR